MSIDKFGSHIFGKDSKSSLGISNSEENILKVVQLSDIKLNYNLVLPFLGVYNPSLSNKSAAFELLQDKRLKYEFPLKSAIISKREYPLRDVILKINGKIIDQPEGFNIKKGDEISFHRKNLSKISSFYGELLIKCPVEIEK